jgi:hypothetical protein
MHLVLELPQALVHEIQALSDLFAEIFFRALGVAVQDPVRDAPPREPRSGSRES